MLNELLKHDNLGDAGEISFVLFQALTPDRKQTLTDVRQFCVSNLFSISLSFEGIVRLLEFAGMIDVDSLTIALNNNSFDLEESKSQDNYFQRSHFYHRLFQRLKDFDCIGELFNERNLRFNHATNQYYVRSHLIGFKFFTIRNLLLKLAFLKRDETIPDHLLVASEFTDFFNDAIISGIKTSPGLVAFDLNDLSKVLERKAEFGKKGELFALSHEHLRLRGHSRLDKVQRLSDEYVSAGYDISSFDSHDSFINDRFIEVKTYSNEISFYWSKHEVEVARQLRSKYWLYLIDATRMNAVGYTPKMIQDPYRKIFENDEWKKETENWKILVEE